MGHRHIIGNLMLFSLLSCQPEDTARIYFLQDVAPSLIPADVENLAHLGPTLIDQGVNFSVYSENAERIDLLLFDQPEDPLPTQQFEMVRLGDVFNLHVEGVGYGQHYGFVAWGPNWPYDPDWFPGSPIGFLADVDGSGHRFNPNKLLNDPYGKALHRHHDWSKGSAASGPSRADHTYAAASKSLIARSDYVWSDHEADWRDLRTNGPHEDHGWNDLIIYEVHPKGFTMNPASGVDHPGSFRGVGEKADYLQDLGITAIELLPIHMRESLTGGYWGYSNLSFFAPEVTYSEAYTVRGRPDLVLDEFKEMVDTLHQSGIEVIIDVVYNHTGEGGLWRERLYFETYDQAFDVNFDPKEIAGIYSFRGLDNAAYYALTEDGQYYVDHTGVGNQTRPNHRPMAQLIMDSLRFMVEELHVDGFRFDLAGILGEQDLNYSEWIDPEKTILQDIIDDPILQQYNTRIIAEPWTTVGTGPGAGGFPASSDQPEIGWGEWNADFRVWWRSFLNNCNWGENGNVCHGAEAESVWGLNTQEINVDGGATLTGSYDSYGWNGRRPYHSVNYVTVHDGMTMYDLFSYDEKQNGCGLLYPVCCDDPLSVWCDPDEGEDHNRSRNQNDEALKRQSMRNLFVAMLISHGTPMIYGGDEWLRTQFGNNNAWSSAADNEWNWFRWGEWQSTYAQFRYRMHDFVREMIQLRKAHAYAFSPSDYGNTMPLAWKNAANEDMTDTDWGGRHVAMHYYNNEDLAAQPELLVLINGEGEDIDFSLPDGREWVRIVDTQSYFDTPEDEDDDGGFFQDQPDADPYQSANISLEAPEAINGDTYRVMAQSIVILKESL